MWHLRKANYFDGQLFHTLDEVTAFILKEAEKMERYSLSFVPIWQPQAAKPVSPNEAGDSPLAGLPKFPIPMSHTE